MTKVKRMWLTIIEKGHNHKNVLIYTRDNNGKRFRFICTDYYPYFYVDEGTPIPDKKEIINTMKIDPKIKRSIFKKNLVKIFVNRTTSVPKIRDYFHDRGFITYEADVLYPLRFRIDKQIYEGFFVPIEIFDRSLLRFDGKPYKKNKKQWWIDSFFPVSHQEIRGF